MKFILTDHLKRRLKLRKISINIVENIFKKSQEFYWDNLRNHHIAVSRVQYKGKMRKMLVVYDKMEEIIEFITVHPIADEEINQRVKSGRWIYEKKQN